MIFHFYIRTLVINILELLPHQREQQNLWDESWYMLQWLYPPHWSHSSSSVPHLTTGLENTYRHVWIIQCAQVFTYYDAKFIVYTKYWSHTKRCLQSSRTHICHSLLVLLNHQPGVYRAFDMSMYFDCKYILYLKGEWYNNRVLLQNIIRIFCSIMADHLTGDYKTRWLFVHAEGRRKMWLLIFTQYIFMAMLWYVHNKKMCENIHVSGKKGLQISKKDMCHTHSTIFYNDKSI